jgi:hypothetical protein
VIGGVVNRVEPLKKSDTTVWRFEHRNNLTQPNYSRELGDSQRNSGSKFSFQDTKEHSGLDTNFVRVPLYVRHLTMTVASLKTATS